MNKSLSTDREPTTDQSHNTTKISKFIAVVYRSKDDSKLAASPKAYVSIGDVHKSWNPRAFFMTGW